MSPPATPRSRPIAGRATLTTEPSMKARLEPRMVAASVPVGCAAGVAPAGRAATAWATPRSHGPAVAVLIGASGGVGGEAPERAVRGVDRLLDDLVLPLVSV